jgi:hypothetical protein
VRKVRISRAPPQPGAPAAAAAGPVDLRHTPLNPAGPFSLAKRMAPLGSLSSSAVAGRPLLLEASTPGAAEETELSIAFTPTFAGPCSTHVDVFDPASGTRVLVTLRGFAMVPDVSIEPAARRLDFGSLLLGQVRTLPFIVANNSAWPASCTASIAILPRPLEHGLHRERGSVNYAGGNAFSLDVTTIAIPPRGQQKFTVGLFLIMLVSFEVKILFREMAVAAARCKDKDMPSAHRSPLPRTGRATRTGSAC